MEVIIIILKDYTPLPYSIFFKLMYGEVDVVTGCCDPKVLFQVYGLAEKYIVVQEIVIMQGSKPNKKN